MNSRFLISILMIACCVIGYFLRGLTLPEQTKKQVLSTNEALVLGGEASFRQEPVSQEGCLSMEKVTDFHVNNVVSPKPQHKSLQNEVFERIEQDPAGAYQWLLTQKGLMDPGSFVMYQDVILKQWGESDPAAAGELLSKLENKELQSSLAKALSIGWANANIAQAFSWLESSAADGLLDSEGVMDQCYINIIGKYAEQSPESAVGILEALDSDELKLRLISPIIKNFAALDLDQAIAWLSGIESDEVRNEGMRELINQSGEGLSPKTLAAVIDNQERISAFTLASAFEVIAKKDPARAIEVLSSVSLEKQPSIARSITMLWLERDESAAMDWLSNQKDDSIHEAIAPMVAKRKSYKEPVTAIYWANSISTPEKRMSSISNIIKSTNEVHLQDVKEYLNSINMTVHEIELLEGVVNKRIRCLESELFIPNR